MLNIKEYQLQTGQVPCTIDGLLEGPLPGGTHILDRGQSFERLAGELRYAEAAKQTFDFFRETK